MLSLSLTEDKFDYTNLAMNALKILYLKLFKVEIILKISSKKAVIH